MKVRPLPSQPSFPIRFRLRVIFCDDLLQLFDSVRSRPEFSLNELVDAVVSYFQ